MTNSNSTSASGPSRIVWCLIGAAFPLFISGAMAYLPVILGSAVDGEVAQWARIAMPLFALAVGLLIVAAFASYRRGRRIDGVGCAAIALLFVGLAGWLGGVSKDTRRDDTRMQVRAQVVDGRHVVYVGGRIGPTLRGRIANAVGDAQDLTLCLDSYGGDAMAAADVAESLAGRNVTAVALKCWSSCAYLIAAADERLWVGPNERTGAVMVHDVSAPGSFPAFGRARVDSALDEIGVPAFADALRKIGTGPVCALSEERMASLGVAGRSVGVDEYATLCGVPAGPGRGEWGVTVCP